MKDIELRELFDLRGDQGIDFLRVRISPDEAISIYARSLQPFGNAVLFIGKAGDEKALYVLRRNDKDGAGSRFHGGATIECKEDADSTLTKHPMSNENAAAIQGLFAFARPVLLGIQDSIGFGDRLGLANPGHLRALRGSRLRPVLAQQSIRELARTQCEPEDVMAAAVWAVLQEGYTSGFGADADHLKTTRDVDRLVNAGFTMFTFDPGEYVVDEADSLSPQELEARANALQLSFLDGDAAGVMRRYDGENIRVTNDLRLTPDRVAVLRALLKYGGVIEHTIKMYRHLKQNHPRHPAEVELSVDETEAVTTPFEHFFVVSELKRRGVALVSLAPRFVGQLEKGIDYIGDLELFKKEYLKHVAIANMLGPYKISIHSGSDKFSLYAAIGALRQGHVHVKTAGTSYLEALKTIAASEPALFREILDFARAEFEAEKRTYHVSAKLEHVPAAGQCPDEELVALFEQNDARQVLHVTFGRVLTAQRHDGGFLFRDRVLTALHQNEERHYANLRHHLGRHVRSFDQSQ